jgi:hypothetical protein
VFNLEVDGEHVYHVGLNGVLVHNTCTKINGTWRIDEQIVDKNGVTRTVWMGIRGPSSWTAADRRRAWTAMGRLDGKGPQRTVLARLKDGTIKPIVEVKELHHMDARHLGGTNSPIRLLQVWPEEHSWIDEYRHIGYEVIEILSGGH